MLDSTPFQIRLWKDTMIAAVHAGMEFDKATLVGDQAVVDYAIKMGQKLVFTGLNALAVVTRMPLKSFEGLPARYLIGDQIVEGWVSAVSSPTAGQQPEWLVQLNKEDDGWFVARYVWFVGNEPIKGA